MRKVKQIVLSMCVACVLFLTMTVYTNAAGNVHKATSWDEVNTLISQANDGDIIDITQLQGTKPNTNIHVTKSVTLLGDSTLQSAYYTVCIVNANFDVAKGKTLTLEKLYIENKIYTQSIITGEGNVVVKDAKLAYSTENGLTTEYNTPAAIDIQGDVRVEGSVQDVDGMEVYTTAVCGTFVNDREGMHTGKAGDAINAKNVVVNGGNIQGGMSIDINVDGGNAVVASGNIIVNGKRGSGINKNRNTTYIYGHDGKNGGHALVAGGNVTVNGGVIKGGEGINASEGNGGSAIVASGDITLNGEAYTVNDKTKFTCSVEAGFGQYCTGIPVQFTPSNGFSRKLTVQSAAVVGKDRYEGADGINGNIANCTVKMSANDIAIIDSSRIGWYTDVPLFSEGYYHITNAVDTWGKTDNATYIEDVNVRKNTSTISVTAEIPNPSYLVTIPTNITFDKQKQALEKYRNSADGNDQYGNPVVVAKDIEVSATNVQNLFDDLGSKAQLDISVAFDNELRGTKDNNSVLPYKVKQNNAELTTGSQIGTFYNDIDLTTLQKENKTKFEILINRADIKKAETYSGTLTFTIGQPAQEEA